MPEVREGTRINNYLLEARLGAGSFGEVWRAKHHVFDTRVAVKIPTNPQYVRNLQREGVAVHGLHHPNIVRALDLDPYADPPYYIMEFVDGPSLRQTIDHYKSTLSIQAVVAILRGTLKALVAAHEAGLVHRDIKPPNILLSHPLADMTNIAEESVKVTDFGLGQVGGNTTKSIMQSGSLRTEDGKSISGTLAYMAPEQREGGDVDQRSDLYACGIVLFEMLTGDRPQGGELPGSLRSGVPAFLDQVYQRSYARRERRFGSAVEMLNSLEARGRKHPPVEWEQAGNAMISRCPGCRGEVRRGDQFCIACGRQLVSSVPRCNTCQAFVHANDRFCIFCGHDLRILSG